MLPTPRFRLTLLFNVYHSRYHFISSSSRTFHLSVEKPITSSAQAQCSLWTYLKLRRFWTNSHLSRGQCEVSCLQMNLLSFLHQSALKLIPARAVARATLLPKLYQPVQLHGLLQKPLPARASARARLLLLCSRPARAGARAHAFPSYASILTISFVPASDPMHTKAWILGFGSSVSMVSTRFRTYHMLQNLKLLQVTNKT